MQFTITHPMHSHPYNPELVSGAGVVEASCCESLQWISERCIEEDSALATL